jgi:hypothetical protein
LRQLTTGSFSLFLRQVWRFMAENPGLKAALQSAPDDATQPHQLYVQWLDARVGTPDVLQLDVVDRRARRRGVRSWPPP